MPCYRSQVSNLIGWGSQEHTVVRHFCPIKCSFVAVTRLESLVSLSGETMRGGGKQSFLSGSVASD